MSAPMSWWMSQAYRVQPRPCPKCHGGPTSGRYMIVNRGTGRVVEEFCYACGWCIPIFTQDTSFAIRAHGE